MDKQISAKRLPFVLSWDVAPVDISFVFAGEKPAGKHGFLSVKGDSFIFEDGTVPRFWGTNVNSAANFPEHRQADRIARRLAAFGVNIVRFHQLDAEWSTPNIFQFTKGERKGHTRTLDAQSLDRLDYFIARLKEEGIYLYLDMLTYRKFKSGDGVDSPESLADAAKPYTNFDSRLIELQKEFNEQLWTHVNSYTGLAYKDEPAIVLTEITNENDMFFPDRRVILEPYRGRLEEVYRLWSAERGIARDADFTAPDADMIDFFIHVQKRYFEELYAHLRSIGLRIPVAGTNWSICGGLLEAQSEMDFMDAHYYWNDWTWRGDNKKFKNAPMFGARDQLLSQLTFSSVKGKPFIVSEWDDPWPNDFRAASSPFLSAIGCFQGWQGFIIHTYRYHNDENIEMIGKPITSDAIGGVYYRGGVYDTFNDPAKFGLFPHAALMIRRSDVKQAKEIIEIAVPRSATPKDLPDQVGLHERHGVRVFHNCRFQGTDPAEGRMVGTPTVGGTETDNSALSDTGELFRNWREAYGYIDADRTKIVYGMLGGRGEVQLKGLSVLCGSDFAVIALSSLSEADLSLSDNILMTAVGRCDNRGSEYNEDHTVQIDCGVPPTEIEVIKARVSLSTSVKRLKVWAVSDRGFFIGVVPSRYENGNFVFDIGEAYPSMYYLIQAE